MDFVKLDQASDDPRPRWKLVAEQIFALRLRYVPEAERTEIERLRVPPLVDRLTAVYVTRGSEADAQAAFTDFGNALMRDAGDSGERARKAAGNGVDELADQFTRTKHHGLEVEGLKITLRPGERALVIGWLETKTNQRTISRSEYRDAARPVTWSRSSTWNGQFLSLETLAELEREEAKIAERQHMTNYGRNLDLP